MQEIIVRRLWAPLRSEEDMEWFCRSLGLLGKRDRGKTGMRIFLLLAYAARENQTMDIDKLAEKMNMTRTAIIHHIKAMEAKGLVERRNGKVGLRAYNFESIVNEIRKDMLRTIESIREIAEEMDRKMNMPVRKKD
ncbi:MAG: MarR family transcriptional regulator [Candidatus Aenigmarchaeota archaeon]|nr:MarR family transcriptional regulator [Candidatus Aenigmarchaeota archaeon]